MVPAPNQRPETASTYEPGLILVDQEDSGYVMLFPDGERIELGLAHEEIEKVLLTKISSGPDLTPDLKLANLLSGPIFVMDTKPYANLQAVQRKLGLSVFYLRRTQLVKKGRDEMNLSKTPDNDIKVLLRLWQTEPAQFKRINWAEEDFKADARGIHEMKLQMQQHRNKARSAELLGRGKDTIEHYEMLADSLEPILGKRVRQLEKKYPFLAKLKVVGVSQELILNLMSEAGLPSAFENEWMWRAHLGLTKTYGVLKGKISRRKATKEEVQRVQIMKPIHGAAMLPFAGTYGATTKQMVDRAMADSKAVGKPLLKRQAVNRVATKVWTDFYHQAAPVLREAFNVDQT